MTTPVVTATPKPTAPIVQPKPVTTPVQTVVSGTGSTTGGGNS